MEGEERELFDKKIKIMEFDMSNSYGYIPDEVGFLCNQLGIDVDTV